MSDKNETNQKPTDNRSATQKLSDLESATASLFNVNDNLARDVMTLKDAIKLLDNKVNAVVKASNGGEPLTDAVLTRIMLENNVADLTQKVANMAAQGFIVPEDTVSDNSFVVGSELDDSDVVQNPRLQFALKALPADTQAKILGAKVGDTLLIQEGKLKFKVLESYKIQDPLAPTVPVEVVPPVDAAVSDAAPAGVPDGTATA